MNKNKFAKIYKWKDAEYRFDENNICLGVFYKNKFYSDGKNVYCEKGKKLTKEKEKRLIEWGKFMPIYK